MLIIPVIYIKNGRCVSMQAEQDVHIVYADDPTDMVGRWFDKGVTRIHLHDVDGDEAGRVSQAELICQIAFRFPNLRFQVSGGIRTLPEIEAYLKAGIAYLVIAPKTTEESDFVLQAAKAFPKKLMVAIEPLGNHPDADAKVITPASKQVSDLDVFNLGAKFDQPSIEGIVYSDAVLDGAINIDRVAKLASFTTTPVLAFKGINDLDDVRALYAESDKGICAAMIDACLHGKSIDILEAQAYCDEFEE